MEIMVITDELVLRFEKLYLWSIFGLTMGFLIREARDIDPDWQSFGSCQS